MTTVHFWKCVRFASSESARIVSVMKTLAPPVSPHPDVCHACAFYSSANGTCARLVVGFSKNGQVLHGYAKFARMDPKQCGPSAANFQAKLKKID
jgi:hypothetical protein